MEYHDPPLTLGKISPRDAAMIVYSDDVIQEAHPGLMSIGEWIHGERTLEIEMPIDPSLQHELPLLFSRRRVRALVNQKVCQDTKDVHELYQEIWLDIPGGHLLDINPSFLLQRLGENSMTSFRCRVKVKAHYPPPFGNMVGRFMLQNARKDVQHYRKILQGRFPLPYV